MKVALVWLGAISRDTGGRTYLRGILEPLAFSRNIELDVYLADSDFDLPSACRVHYYPRPPMGAIGRVAMEALVVRQVLRRKYDVLLAPFNYLPMAWRGPSVVVQHNLLVGKGAAFFRTGLRSTYRRTAVASSVRRATYIIAVSDHLRDRLLEWYPEVDSSRVRVVQLAPATELLSTPPRYADNPLRTVLVVGALWAYKGAEDAVDAFSIVSQAHGDLRLAIAGPGTRSARRAILKRAELRGVRGRVELLGNLAHRDLAACYREAAALLFLSRIESFGLPVVEAMAMGVPVVARRIPALTEVAGEAPLWVDIDADTFAIADALEAALSDPQARARAISRGLACTAALSWSRTAELTADVLFEAAEEPVKHEHSTPLPRPE